MALNREQLDALRTADVPLVFVPRCHPDSGTVAAYMGDGVMQVDCVECGAKVVEFEVAWPDPLLAAEAALLMGPPPDPTDPACPSCGWAMSDHGDPPMCPPVPGEQGEGGSRR